MIFVLGFIVGITATLIGLMILVSKIGSTDYRDDRDK